MKVFDLDHCPNCSRAWFPLFSIVLFKKNSGFPWILQVFEKEGSLERMEMEGTSRIVPERKPNCSPSQSSAARSPFASQEWGDEQRGASMGENLGISRDLGEAGWGIPT